MVYNLIRKWPRIQYIGPQEQRELLEAAKKIEIFINWIPGGESYWIDPDGGQHCDDMGYAGQFIGNLIDYLEHAINSSQN